MGGGPGPGTHMVLTLRPLKHSQAICRYVGISGTLVFITVTRLDRYETPHCYVS